jgi:hypothetical protein
MDARARLRRPRATTEMTRERLAVDDALERRLRAMEHAVEKADQRTSTLAKLIKCAKDSEDEQREAMRETIERLRQSVENARRERDAVEASREEETRAREVRELTAATASAKTRAGDDDASAEREAFERRMDARVEKMMTMLEASARSASGGGEVAALREELRLEREARRNETEALAVRVDALSRALANAEAKLGRARGYERASDARRSYSNGAARARDHGGSRRGVGGWNDDEDDDGREDEDEEDESDEDDPNASSKRSRENARPELEARRRRLRALYRELQTLSF